MAKQYRRKIRGSQRWLQGQLLAQRPPQPKHINEEAQYENSGSQAQQVENEADEQQNEALVKTQQELVLQDSYEEQGMINDADMHSGVHDEYSNEARSNTSHTEARTNEDYEDVYISDAGDMGANFG